MTHKMLLHLHGMKSKFFKLVFSLISSSLKIPFSPLKQTLRVFCVLAEQLAGRSQNPHTALSRCCEYKVEWECISHWQASFGMQNKNELYKTRPGRRLRRDLNTAAKQSDKVEAKQAIYHKTPQCQRKVSCFI